MWEECGPCPVFASYTPAFALQLKKKHGKPSFNIKPVYRTEKYVDVMLNFLFLEINVDRY